MRKTMFVSSSLSKEACGLAFKRFVWNLLFTRFAVKRWLKQFIKRVVRCWIQLGRLIGRIRRLRSGRGQTDSVSSLKIGTFPSTRLANTASAVSHWTQSDDHTNGLRFNHKLAEATRDRTITHHIRRAIPETRTMGIEDFT